MVSTLEIETLYSINDSFLGYKSSNWSKGETVQIESLFVYFFSKALNIERYIVYAPIALFFDKALIPSKCSAVILTAYFSIDLFTPSDW
jgi:hypothetical protein